MAITFITQSQGISNANNYSLSTMDSTGGNFIVVIVTGDPSFLPGIAVSDNKSNTYTALPVPIYSGSATRHNITLWYAKGATVGVGHIISLGDSGGQGAYGAGCAAVFSGVATTATFDDQNGFGQTTTGNTTIQPGSITPHNNNELIIAGWGIDDPTNTSWTIDSSFTMVEHEDVQVGVAFGAAIAYLIQGTAAAINPTFTRSNANTTGGDTSIIASFVPLAGGNANPTATGVQATSGVGTVVINGAGPSIAVSGVQATSGLNSVSTITADANYIASGVQATSGVGTVTVTTAGPNISVSGVQATSGVGTVTVSAGGSGNPQMRRFGEIEGGTLIIGPTNVSIY